MLVPLLFVLVMLAFLWMRRPKRPPGFPPGPPTVLIFGNLWSAITVFRGKIRTLFTTDRKKYGDIVGYVLPGGDRIVHVYNYDDIKEACANSDFAGRPHTFGLLVRTYDQHIGLVFSEGSAWVEHRRFALRNLRDMGFGRNTMESIALEEFDVLAEEMKRQAGSPVKVNMVFNSSVLNIIWRIVAGKRLEMGDPYTSKLIESVDEMLRLIGPQSPMNLLPALRHIAPEWSGYAGVVRHREFTADMFKTIVDEHRQTLDPTQPRDFIDLFLIEMQQPDAEARQFTEQNLTLVGMDFFVAGMETTSTTLSWAVLFMVMHPDIQTRVQQEIEHVTGESVPSYGDRLRMPFTVATLMEVSRRCTVIPQAVPHGTTADTTLRGHKIPKNTQVLMHLEAVHMDPKYWKDPEVFRPERFINSDGTVRKDERLIPFGVGKRFCLGETLARMEIFILFTCLMQKFRLTAAPGQKLTLENTYAVVNQPAEFFVTFEARDK